MSGDLKNSILLWVGTLVFVGLFWAWLHFDLGTRIPDEWIMPILGIGIAINVLRLVWDRLRRNKARQTND